MALLLWDIDGTLLDADGAGRRSLIIALYQVFNLEGNLDGVMMKGQTDKFIISSLFQKYKINPDQKEILRFYKVYESTLVAQLNKVNFRLLSGVPAVLRNLNSHSEYTHGLITGNSQNTAWAKLRHAGISHYFLFGAFGDEHEDRNELARIAIDRAPKHPLENQPIVVIGDTPLDVACARSIGAYAIAVATGFSTREQLLETGANAVIDDLSNPGKFRNLLDSLLPRPD